MSLACATEVTSQLAASNKLEKIIGDLGITRTHVSLADDREYAIAVAVIEK